MLLFVVTIPATVPLRSEIPEGLMNYPVLCSLLKYGFLSYVNTTATHVARVWQELDYRIDICRITKGGYIEHL